MLLKLTKLLSINHNQQIKLQGEKLASQYLITQGYRVIGTNVYCARWGEIDILAIKDGGLVGIEVKTRTSDYSGHPLESITPSKIKKLHNSMHFLTTGKYSAYSQNYHLEAISQIIVDGKISERIHIPIES